MGLADRDYMKAERWQRDQRQRLAAWHWRRFPLPRTTRARGRLARYAVAVVLVATPALAVGYAAGAKVGPFAPAPLLEWGGTEFSNKSEFEAWLRERGGSYEAWASKHPAAAAKLERGR